MLLLVSLFAIAAAKGPAPVAPKPEPAVRVCQAVAVTSPEAPGQKRPLFSSTRIMDLEFRVAVKRRVEGFHSVRFKLYTPNGHLYQELSVPFNAGGKKGDAPQVAARLPVAGTSITTSSLFGRWRVEPHLDGDLTPCGAATRFWSTE